MGYIYIHIELNNNKIINHHIPEPLTNHHILFHQVNTNKPEIIMPLHGIDTFGGRKFPTIARYIINHACEEPTEKE